MMNVEEALIDLGDKPLYKSTYSKVLKAMLNALIPTDTTITMNHTGQELLTEVYQISDPELQEKILEKSVGSVRNSDMYRSSILTLSGMIGLGVIVLTLMELTGNSIFAFFK
jgi:hypothetical protein